MLKPFQKRTVHIILQIEALPFQLEPNTSAEKNWTAGKLSD